MKPVKVIKILDEAWFAGLHAGMSGEPKPDKREFVHEKLRHLTLREMEYGYKCGTEIRQNVLNDLEAT